MADLLIRMVGANTCTTAGAGLGARFTDYMRDMNDLMYLHFASEAALDIEFDKQRAKWSHNQTAPALIDDIIDNKEKVCRTYTRSHFTLGHVATSIAEAKNSSLKSGKKDSLKKLTMGELSRTLLAWEAKLDIQSVTDIMKTIVKPTFKDRPWSDWVNDKWKEEHTKSSQMVVSVSGKK